MLKVVRFLESGEAAKNLDEKENFKLGCNLRQIRFSPKQMLKILLYPIFVLSAISFVLGFIKYKIEPASTNLINIFIGFFYFDRENNIPTYFSSIILLLAAGILAYIYLIKSTRNDKFRMHWGVLGVGFLLMSIDESVGFHELLSQNIGDRIEVSISWFYYAWVIPGIVFVALVGIFFSRFLMSLNPQSRKHFILAGLIYVGGAVGFEIFSGHITVLYEGKETFIYSVFSNMEELLEMVGVTYFIYGLLFYLNIQEKKEKYLYD